MLEEFMAGLRKGQLLIIRVYYSVEREQNGFLLCCCHPEIDVERCNGYWCYSRHPRRSVRGRGTDWGLMGWWFWRYQNTAIRRFEVWRERGEFGWHVRLLVWSESVGSCPMNWRTSMACQADKESLKHKVLSPQDCHRQRCLQCTAVLQLIHSAKTFSSL